MNTSARFKELPKILVYLSLAIIFVIISRTIARRGDTAIYMQLTLLVAIIVALKYPEFLLTFFVLALPFFPWEVLPVPSGGRGAVVALFILFSYLPILTGRKILRMVKSLSLLSNVGLASALFIGLYYTNAPNYGKFKAQGFLLFAFVPFVIALYIGTDVHRLKRILYSTIIIGIVAGFFAFHRLWSFLVSHSMVTRLTTTFYGGSLINPIMFAIMISAAMLSSLCLSKTCRLNIHRRAFLALCFFLLIILLFTGSRGPLLAYGLSFVGYMAFGKDRRELKKLAVFMLLAVAVTLYLRYAMYQTFGTGHPLTFSESENLNIRKYQNIIALKLFANNPILGVGTGGYCLYDNIYAGSDLRYYPHNISLEILAELGIMGFLFFGLFIFDTLKTGIRLLYKTEYPNHQYRVIFACIFYQFIAALMQSCFSSDIVNNQPVWFFGGLVASQGLSYLHPRVIQFRRSRTDNTGLSQSC